MIQSLECFARKRLPMYDIEVAWVIQPRIESFTVVELDGGNEPTAAKRMILRTLEEFDPDAPAAKPD
ncbi:MULTISPECIES: hypothetical protein [Devosiaceae]|uniref:Uncharacterized protein n=2 Tax=Devosiaceae TaxID=2831106 RepID=A0A1G7ZWR2_9HYPH|nr:MULTISPECIES: hypothetical protein [Devosiaceae]MBO6727948.1 hypothetical protein [Rhizobiaceae bacterium]MVT01017.1 hypothetical protein [Devosia marina]SDH13037.1 hypothetical protein SAMN04487974_12338 [Pelagibacterium luteolum]